jgi:N-acetylneuraminate synthase
MMTGNEVFIIAEIGVNHNGSIEIAKRLIDSCAQAGSGAVKFQTFKTENVMIPFTPKADYQAKNTASKETQFEMVKKLELDQESHFILKKYAHEKNIEFFSTPFDIESLHFLIQSLDLPILKIASGEMTNAPLLLKAALSQKNIIVSTGMSTLGEIEEMLGVLAFGYREGKENNKIAPSRKAFREAYFSEEGKRLLREKVSLLHCTTEYPAPFEEVNLRAMHTLHQCFGLKVGFSDHSAGIALPIAAVALGAEIIEKHVTLDRSLPGPDHKASLEPDELSGMIQAIRQLEKSLGNPYKQPAPAELKNMEIARKSIVAACNIQKGEIFTEDNLTVKRPGGGRSPLQYWDLLGKRSPKSYLENEMIT